MKKIFQNWNTMILALVLIRIGQELGTDSHYARIIHDFIDFFLHIMK